MTGCKIANLVFIRVRDPVKLSANLPAQGEFGFQGKNRREIDEQRKKIAEAYLKNIVQKTALGSTVLSHEVLEVNVAETLANRSEQNGIDLIIITSHGRSGVSRWVMGSVADRILRSVCVPIMMIRAPGCAPGM